jgi:hypothetical protein
MLFPVESTVDFLPFHISKQDSISTRLFVSPSNEKKAGFAQVSAPF